MTLSKKPALDCDNDDTTLSRGRMTTTTTTTTTNPGGGQKEKTTLEERGSAALAGSYQIRKITGLNRTPRPRPSRSFCRLTIQVCCPRRSDWILPKAVVGIRRTYRRVWCKAAIDKCSFAIPRQQTEEPYKLAMKTTTTDEHRGKTPQFL